ncbi:MAG: type III PLP-dependent enzyme [Rhodospirillales bacterium]|nr:type III PLP-dependent enzyme [Rhodospirillales bacterium]
MTRKISRFLAQRRPQTPCLVLDLDIVAQNYAKLRQAMPDAEIFYAMKANPAAEVLALLVRLGSSFDAASINEIDLVLAAGAEPERISFGNTIKKQADIAAAYARGVRLFAFDAWGELEKIAAAAPGSKVFCRIATSGAGAEWPLSRKFGCDPATAGSLLRLAAELGLQPYGLSFHVGSQQRDPEQWDHAVGEAATLFRMLADDGIELEMLNIGGGLPTRYRNRIPTLCAYGAVIRRSLRHHFGNRLPKVIIEPGRQMVGDAGIIQTEVVLIADREDVDSRRWVYLDIGKFGGLAETIDEAIKYPIRSRRRGPADRVVLAGPTCDSADVLYQASDYRLPRDLRIGDKLEIRSAGAYTTTYASIAFNGFEPLRCYCI